jgi:hypothetical protein
MAYFIYIGINLIFFLEINFTADSTFMPLRGTTNNENMA